MNTQGPFKGPTRIAICPEIMAEIVANCPSPLNKTAFINMMLAEALSKSATIYTDKILLEEQQKKAVEERVSAKPSNARAICIENEVRQEEINTPLTPKPPKDPFKSRKFDPALIPPELQKDADLILEWWAVKKGTRSKTVFKRSINQLNGWTPQGRVSSLLDAIAGAWASLYEPKTATPKQGHYRGDPGPDMKHPAHRDFTAERIAAERNGDSEGVLSGIF